MAELQITITHATPEKDESESESDDGNETCMMSSQERAAEKTRQTSATVDDTAGAIVLTSFMSRKSITRPNVSVTTSPQFDLHNNSKSGSTTTGLSFLTTLMSESEHYPQTEHVCKIKTSVARRRVRRSELANSFMGFDKIDEKKFQHAVSSNDEKTVKTLLERGLDPCISDSKKRTALHLAASKGHNTIVSMLLNYGANPDQKDCIGNTPLHLAVCSNHLPVVSVLLEAGTNVLSEDNAGSTPLHLAQSRINVLQRELRLGESSSHHIKDEVLQVADMINKYLKVQGDDRGVEQLSELCHKLTVSNTAEEVSSVNQLLEEFTSLTLQKPKR